MITRTDRLQRKPSASTSSLPYLEYGRRDRLLRPTCLFALLQQQNCFLATSNFIGVPYSLLGAKMDMKNLSQTDMIERLNWVAGTIAQVWLVGGWHKTTVVEGPSPHQTGAQSRLAVSHQGTRNCIGLVSMVGRFGSNQPYHHHRRRRPAASTQNSHDYPVHQSSPVVRIPIVAPRHHFSSLQ